MRRLRRLATHEPSWTEQLLALQGRPITDADRQRAGLHLIDWLGCVLLGHLSPAGAALHRWAVQSEVGPSWTVGGLQLRSDAAALVNGALGNVDELDDLHRGAVVHPGDTIMAAALAVAQREQTTPQALLDAVVRGYEVAIRIGLLAGPAHYQHWYSTATCGVFGAATASASLMQLNATQAMHALAQAGMQASGVWQCRVEPGFSKQLAAGRSAQSGVMAADFAAAGLVGPRLILEGAHGWLAATGSSPNLRRAKAVLNPEPNAPWLIHEVSFKPWPACRHVHPAIACAVRLHEQLPDVEQITRIEINTYQTAVEFADQQHPSTSQEARFSLQHGVAVGLIRGDFELADTQPESLTQPSVMRLRACMHVKAVSSWTRAYPAHYGSEVRVWLRTGEVLCKQIADAPGDPESPMSEAQIVAKAMRSIQAAGYSLSAATEVAAACAALPTAVSMDDFWRTLQLIERF